MKQNYSNQIDIQELKQSIDLVSLFESYGIPVKQKGNKHQCCCPFHDDDTPSLGITPEKGLWNCFGCDASGSAIDFIMKMENVDVSEAKKILLSFADPASAVGIPYIKPAIRVEPKPQPPVPTRSNHALLESIIEHAHKTLLKPNCPAMSYLKARCLDELDSLKIFRIGYVDGSLRSLLPQTEEVQNQLKALGILNDKGNPTFYKCLIVPIYEPDGSLAQIFARGIGDDRRLYLKGTHKGVFNGKAFAVYDEVIVCEAILDALSLYVLGIRNVVATYGTNGWTADHQNLLNSGKARKLILAFDNDKAGDEGANKLKTQLEGNESLSFNRLTLPNAKDINELLMQLKKEKLGTEAIKNSFLSLIAKAPVMGEETPKHTLELLQQSEDQLIFGHQLIIYRIRGLHENTGTSLKVVITAQKEDNLHTDRFDLYTAKARHSFAFQISSKLNLPATRVEDDLTKLILRLETILAERSQPTPVRSVSPVTPKQRQEALSFLTAKNVLANIAKDLTALGYVGETKNKQLAYLIATSRRLNKPLSGIVRSESGAGKSFLMETVAELIPPEDVHYFSRLTSQSLYYMGRESLQNKLLIVDERNGSEESEYPIRTLQTKRRLNLAVPMKNPKTGNIETQEVEILGPIAYMESTTSTEINPENENRSFELYLDESPEQTERIFKAQQKAHLQSKEEQEKKRQRIIEKHHAIQRVLEPVQVKIPFAHLIEFPQVWTRGRRDIDRILSLIETSAYLHQTQRPRQGAGAIIEATPQDYQIAYDLCKNSLMHAWADLPRSAEDLLDKIKRYVKKEASKQHLKTTELVFRRRDIRAYTRLPDHVIKRGIKILEDLEYVHVRRTRQGGTSRYLLASTPPAVNTIDELTTPQELSEKLKSGTV